MASTVVLVAVAAMFLTTLVAATGTHRLGWDFHAGYLDAAESIRRIGTPYSADNEQPYVYPPLLAELLVPVTFLPDDVSSFLAFVASFAAVMGALAVVGVRDIRCYAAVVIWAPAWNALEMANLTAVITLLAALVWRYRNATLPSAAALGGALASKLFLWPVLIWAVATRRAPTALLAIALGLAAALASWAVVGFAGLTSYPHQILEADYRSSYSLVGIASALGIDPLLGRAATFVVGGALLIATAVLGRRGDEARAYTCAIVATLTLTPIVWLHYLTLLVVPVAIERPRFSAVWLLPIVLWACPRAGHGDGLEPYIPALFTALLFALLLVREDDLSASAE
jgi:alpha-1,2-mannosyltransferase